MGDDRQAAAEMIGMLQHSDDDDADADDDHNQRTCLANRHMGNLTDRGSVSLSHRGGL